MQEIAQVLLFDRHGKLVIYLRDDKPDIPYPDHWDLIGGHVEAGETPEQALVRETKEEIGLDLKQWRFFRRYDCYVGDAYPNTKFIYHAKIDRLAADLPLFEGQRLIGIAAQERFDFRFANILGKILEDFIAEGCWQEPVDNPAGKIPAA